jgi:hypothetical protein
MSTKKIPLDQATKDDLRLFAEAVLGLQVHPNSGYATIRAKIAEVHTDDFILLPEDDSTQEIERAAALIAEQREAKKDVQRAAGKVGTSSKGDPMVRMSIAQAEGQGGERPVPVTVNGVTMLIPRGEPVSVPYRYYLALTLAVRTIYEQHRDRQTGELITTKKDVPAYPYNVMSMPSAEEIAAWEDATKDEGRRPSAAA